MILFQVGEGPPEEVDMQARNSHAPCEALVSESMAFTRSCRTPVEYLVGSAFVEDFLFRMWVVGFQSSISFVPCIKLIKVPQKGHQ